MTQDNTRGAYPGRLAFEYLNLSSGSDWYANPTWSRIKRVEDIEITDERSTNDYSAKGHDTQFSVAGARSSVVAFKYRKKRGTDPIFNELQAAYEDQSKVVDYVATDQDIATTGAKGFRGPYLVTKFSESRPYGNVVEYDVELRHADAEREDLPDNAGTFVDWEKEAWLTP